MLYFRRFEGLQVFTADRFRKRAKEKGGNAIEGFLESNN